MRGAAPLAPRYIQRRAADHTGRVISIGQLILFSTKTGDAWLLDPSDQLAARPARDGDPEPIHIEETDTTFAIGWKGHYRIEGLTYLPARDLSLQGFSFGRPVAGPSPRLASSVGLERGSVSPRKVSSGEPCRIPQ